MSTTAAPQVTIGSTIKTTAQGAVSLTGTVAGAAGTSVEIYNGTVALGAALLDASGGWSFALTGLPAASYNFRAVASAPGGVTATATGSAATVVLQPGENIAAIVSGSPAGTTFIFLPGVYNNLTITPNANQTFIGEPGAVLSGSIPVTGWSDAGGYWSTSNFAAPQWGYGTGRNGVAAIPNDLQVDGKAYLRVGSLAEVGAGDFYYGSGRVYIQDNPTGHTTSMLDTTTAFQGGSTTGVTIANLTIENYASVAQHGAIEAENTSGWTLDNVTAIANHGAGAAAGSNMTIEGGSYSDNGETGIHAQNTTGLTINGITADNNNYAQYSAGWDAAGIKILTSTNVTVENSNISSNQGIGLWFDTDVANATIANNVIDNNQGPGIQYEAAYSATITGNMIANNAQTGYVTGYWGADLILVSSSHVTATGNTLVVNNGAEGIGIQEDDRPPDNMGPHSTIDDTVSNNVFVLLGTGKDGAASDGLSSSLVFNGSNVWDHNTFVAQNAQDVDFTWNNAYFWAADPSQLLIDKNGSFTYVANPQAYAAGLTANQGLAVAITSQTLVKDTGISVTDGITNDGAVTLSGTLAGPAGSVVHIYDGTALLGAATVANGAWTYGATLAAGTHALHAIATDPAGQSVSTTAQASITVDQTPASITAIASSLASGARLAAGQSETITLATSKPVQVSGAPALTLSDGGTAGYDAARSTATSLAFVYTTTAGQSSTGLAVSGLALNGGAVVDTAGNALATAALASLPGSMTGILVNPPAAAATPPATGPDTLSVQVSEDAWQGDAQFTVSIDGAQIGGVRTATASHAAGATQDVTLSGTWGAGAHTIGIAFINDAYGGTPSTDRNLYVGQVAYDGRSASGAPASLMGNGTRDFAVPAALVPASLSIQLAEDAWQGNAQYAIAIDGKTISTGNPVTALNASGQSQAVTLQQSLPAGTHDLAISFLNDAYGGSASTDRNLYVKSIAVNGAPVSGGSAALLATSTVHFQFLVPA